MRRWPGYSLETKVRNNELLVDTCGMVKWMDGSLPDTAKAFLLSAHRRYFSVISAWEIRLKPALRSLITPSDIEVAIGKMGLEVQPLLLNHITALVDIQRLPELPHSDPFDHLLIAQALLYDWPILTCDTKFQGYPGVQVVW